MNVIFTQRVDVIESYNEKRDCADQRISSFIRECGYIPFPVPNILDEKSLEEFVRVVRPSGIIFTGGNSLTKYGGNAPERDFTENALMTMAVHENIPAYGFCRGMQFVLDYFGEKLVNVPGHVAVRHVLDNGREVNSYHSQACMTLTGGELVIIARASDGVIEAVKHKNLPVFCNMWHPEREKVFVREDVELVKKLFASNSKEID